MTPDQQSTLANLRELFSSKWPEPDPKAGTGGPGPLFTSGLIAQYQRDKEKHDTEIAALANHALPLIEQLEKELKLVRKNLEDAFATQDSYAAEAAELTRRHVLDLGEITHNREKVANREAENAAQCQRIAELEISLNKAWDRHESDGAEIIRLRRLCEELVGDPSKPTDAERKIAALTAENARYREALEELNFAAEAYRINSAMPLVANNHRTRLIRARDKAQAALTPDTKEQA